ncbi:ABC transporter substrate-binding protein [Aureimonas glaciei]|uniref:ABC transporter substrate-binding protein n=1 Tax=Aureimonas glaciei TaxID=1776957 RepID=A0A916XWJ7_9HYPH|nr:ABC transporter substrate-binding protein [Aureimonas glaciei]GGD15434.1 ABC transporter substrate-binding protein [Aureimonas glaciei]
MPDPRRRALVSGLLAAAILSRAGPARAAALRVATLDYALAQTLIVLGCPPIAISDRRDWAKWVLEPALAPGTVDLGASLDPNMELLAALRPDLILTTDYVGPTEARLSRIAPVRRITIYSEGGSPLPKAIAATREIGAITGRSAEAERYLDETERFFDACATRALPFRGRPVAILSFIDERHVRVMGRPGLYQDVLDRLGLRNAWEAPTNFWGFSTIGLEGLAVISDAFAVADYLPAEAAATLPDSPLWRQLPFVRNGTVPVLPSVLVFGGVPSARRFASLLLDMLEQAA